MSTNSVPTTDATDYKVVSAIEARAMDRETNGPALDVGADSQMAADDVRDFNSLKGEFARMDAAVQLSVNMDRYPMYRAGLEKADPVVVEIVEALNAENNKRISEKDARKSDEMAVIHQAFIERAQQWSPTEAAQQAFRDSEDYKVTQDATERFYMRNDMGLNANANPHYGAALAALDAALATEVKTQYGEVMTSQPGARMVYNDTPGQAGAEIVNPNGTRTMFGGKDAIERYAGMAGLTDQEKQTLLELDALANKHRVAPSTIQGIELNLTDADLARVAVVRERDSAQARSALGLNSVEQDTENQRTPVSADLSAKSAAWAAKGKSIEGFAPGGNSLESDEIFTAAPKPSNTAIPPEIESAYLRVGTKFYDRADSESLVFEDKGNRLETRSNSESVAKSLVRIAQARGWDEIKVSGTEAFRKEVWLEAVQHGMSVKGYRVTEKDKLNLAHGKDKAPLSNESGAAQQFRGRETAATSQTQNDPKTPMGQAFTSQPLEEVVKKFPQLAGAAAAVAALERKAVADGLTSEQRAVVNARVRQNVVNSIERGEFPKVPIKEVVPIEQQQQRTQSKEYSR